MAIFRVERNKGYTVMSNHHLRNKELTLKAKGLLSQMLSLPEDWDYTLAGLSRINRESIDAIRTAVWELEKAGYITRKQGRDAKGKLTSIVYTIYEQPRLPEPDKQALEDPMSGRPSLEHSTLDEPSLENPISGGPLLENPTSDEPVLENPTPGKPISKNPMQLIKEIQKKEIRKNDSYPFFSGEPSVCGKDGTTFQSAVEVYREIIKDNIAYEILVLDNSMDKNRIDEIVDTILEIVCTARKKIRIAGDDYPAAFVRERYMKLNCEHVRYVLRCMSENTTKIRNIKQYLRAVLFNAPSTMESYYTSLVAHDLAKGADGMYERGRVCGI